MRREQGEFELWDLRVEVVGRPEGMVCNHRPGDWFELSGENLRFPPGQTFPLYPLAALLPLLPAKQRDTDPADWMTTDTEVACPDPHCGARFRIVRTGRRTFRHGDVTRVPLGPA
ncbi:MAG: TIGR04076 family protein [Gemmatimonadota bacterium]